MPQFNASSTKKAISQQGDSTPGFFQNLASSISNIGKQVTFNIISSAISEYLVKNSVLIWRRMGGTGDPPETFIEILIDIAKQIAQKIVDNWQRFTANPQGYLASLFSGS